MNVNLRCFLVLLLTLQVQIGLAQSGTISGTVTDEKGVPVPGVNITIQGSSSGTNTDFDGKYTIQASEDQVLHFSSVGFEDQYITVGTNTTINVSLKEGTALDEVIITALGIEKIADAVTSSQKIVTADELNQAANPNAVQALTGKVAGLRISQTNSSVDASNSIQLRGMRTITGNNEALIVIDGVKSSASVLESLPPDAIDNINVIKGAQGAALYGADGVNGVIIINTVKGSKRGLQVSYKGSIDVESVSYLPKRQTAYGQGWDHTRDQYENGAWGPEFDGQETMYGLPMYDYDGDGLITLDGLGWGSGTLTSGDNPAAFIGPYEARPDEVKKFFRDGITYSNGVTLNTGSEGNYLLMNLDNTKRQFVIEDDENTKTSFMVKGGAQVDKFSFEGGINYIRTDIRQTTLMFDEGSNDALYWHLLQSSADIPIRWYKDYPDQAYSWNAYYQNPYWRMKNVRQSRTRDMFSANAGLGYKINDHINIRYTGNLRRTFDKTQNHRNSYNSEMFDPDITSGNIASAVLFSDRDWFDYYGDFMINFDYDLTDDLNLKANVGHNYQENRYQIAENGGLNLEVEGVYNMANVTQPLPASDLDNGHYRKNAHALFGNLDLAYKNYLFFNATARNEWSSTLPSKHNSFFYPSAGLSFVPTKAFDFGGDVLTHMKISGNWTRVGNSSAINWYTINSTAVLASGYPFSGVNSYRNNMAPADPNIKPEFVTSTELNLDLGFFNDRITLGASIYEQDTKDLITQQTVSSASGINSQLVNIGKMEAKGAEVNLGFTPIQTQDFSWDVNVGYSYSSSEVTKVSDEADEISLVSGSNWGVFAQKGSIFPLIKVSEMERDPDGRIVINPDNGNPVITSSLQNAGSAVPKSIYDFATSISYKGFRLSAVADLRLGSKLIADVQSGMAFNGTLKESGDLDRNQGGFVMPNSVYKDDNGNYVENTSIKTGGNDYADVITYYSSIYSSIGENLLVDGKAFKVREIALSYSLPYDFINPAGFREITLGVHARNPFTKLASDNLNYADPETSNYSGNAIGVASRTQYPNTRVFGGSLNIKF